MRSTDTCAWIGVMKCANTMAPIVNRASPQRVRPECRGIEPRRFRIPLDDVVDGLGRQARLLVADLANSTHPPRPAYLPKQRFFLDPGIEPSPKLGNRQDDRPYGMAFSKPLPSWSLGRTRS